MRHHHNPFGIALVACSVLLTSCGASRMAEAHIAAPRHTLTAFSPAGSVNPLIGTSGDGNVFPGASAPFGMVQWSPDTSAGGLSRPGGYAYGDRIIAGFSLTHLSGAGCVAFGNLPFMPTARPISRPPLPNGSPYSDRFDHAQEHASPAYYAVRLGSGIGVRLTATARTGFGSFTFPGSHAGSVIVNAAGGAGGHLNTDHAIDASIRISGSRQLNGWARGGHFCNLGNTYTLYFAAVFDRPFASALTWQGSVLRSGSRSAQGRHAGAVLTFDTHANRQVQVKVGLSYVSVHDAQLNLNAEDPGWRFETVRSKALERWNQLLNRIQVTGGTASNTRVFYTALYHAFLHPNIFSDVGGRYIGFDGRIHRTSRTQYANFSGWDIYRSEVQLLAWLLPHTTGDMMQSLVANAEQGGWLPKWPVANAETGEMN
ncbi:MAG TPA: glycoside hydrolase domain-containing protein, partial [Chloroflexota bacterium]